VQQASQRAIALPLLKAAMAGLVGRIAVRQIVPGSAGAQNPEDSIQHGARIAPGSPTLAMRRHVENRLENRPLGVAEVHAQDLYLSVPIYNNEFSFL
jgi:hypothetical protein